MKETVNINISGMVFHIDVDAYEILRNYLEKIKSYFSNSEEGEEIMADIETRIAELFNENINEQKQVVNQKDVERVMEIMGRPEQYAQEEDMEEEAKGPQERAEKSRIRKRLFRDPDDRVLGGVASGIAAYLGLDPVWMRLLFVIGFFSGFVGFFFYIVLWIIIPEARTASDRLRMKGEAVNVENIGKTFRDGASKENERINEIDTNTWSEKIEHFFTQFFSAVATLLKGVFKALGKLLGVAFFLIGILMIFGLIAGLFTSNLIFTIGPAGIFSIDSLDFLRHIFETDGQFIMAKYAVILAVVIPIIALIYGGMRLLFGIRGNTGVGIGLGVLWVISLIWIAGIGLQLSVHFDDWGEVKEYAPVVSNYDDFVIKLGDELPAGEEVMHISDDDFFFIWDEPRFHMGYPTFRILPGMGDSLVLEVEKGASAATLKKSMEKARDIQYHFSQQANLINLDSYYSFDQKDKIRGQKVSLTLRLPVGKIVYLDPSLSPIIFDIDNVTGTYDGNMMGKRWVMLEEGLTCLDCPDIDGISSKELNERMNTKRKLSPY